MIRKVLLPYQSNKSSDKRKLDFPPLSLRISKTYQNIIIFKWSGPSLKNKEISVGIFRYLQASSGICGHLQISAGIFRYLPVSSDICRCEPHLNKIMTCHKEYTESLQAPPSPMKPASFSKAWSEKPRSVSLWPGLAGLKACRLPAGRPGRLRTLPETGTGRDCGDAAGNLGFAADLHMN